MQRSAPPPRIRSGNVRVQLRGSIGRIRQYPIRRSTKLNLPKVHHGDIGACLLVYSAVAPFCRYQRRRLIKIPNREISYRFYSNVNNINFYKHTPIHSSPCLDNVDMSKANLPLAFDISTLSSYSRKKLGCR